MILLYPRADVHPCAMGQHEANSLFKSCLGLALCTGVNFPSRQQQVTFVSYASFLPQTMPLLEQCVLILVLGTWLVRIRDID